MYDFHDKLSITRQMGRSRDLNRLTDNGSWNRLFWQANFHSVRQIFVGYRINIRHKFQRNMNRIAWRSCEKLFRQAKFLSSSDRGTGRYFLLSRVWRKFIFFNWPLLQMYEKWDHACMWNLRHTLWNFQIQHNFLLIMCLLWTMKVNSSCLFKKSKPKVLYFTFLVCF
jgi:hypothetical protein